MPEKKPTPDTPHAAMTLGYQHIGSRTDHNDNANFSLAAGPAVDCQISPPGTLCFDYTYPNGKHVVGYCDGNGNCQLYSQ